MLISCIQGASKERIYVAVSLRYLRCLLSLLMSTCMQGNRPGSIGDEWRTRGENSPAWARVMPKPPRRLRVAFSPPADNGHARAHDRNAAPALVKARRQRRPL